MMSDDEEMEGDNHSHPSTQDNSLNSPTRKTDHERSGKFEHLSPSSACESPSVTRTSCESPTTTPPDTQSYESLGTERSDPRHLRDNLSGEEMDSDDVSGEVLGSSQKGRLGMGVMAELQQRVKASESDMSESDDDQSQQFEKKNVHDNRKVTTAEDNHVTAGDSYDAAAVTSGDKNGEVSSTEFMDVVNDLPAVTSNQTHSTQGKEAGDRSNGDSSDHYDFSAIESSSATLNVEANKQRALLRQKGSLAGRRKPSRASLRATAHSNAQVIETVAVNDVNEEKKLLNGDVKEEDKVTDRQTEPDDTNTSQAVLSEGPVLRTGKTIQGVKTAIVLPGINDLAANKSRLKASKPPVPLPKDKSNEPPADQNENHSSPAPWAKFKRQSKVPPPRGESEKTKQESEPERPAWMKDAEMKRKRASHLLTERDQQKQQQTGEVEESEGESQSVAPWMKEAAELRKHNDHSVSAGPLHVVPSIEGPGHSVVEHENPFKGHSMEQDNPFKNQGHSVNHENPFKGHSENILKGHSHSESPFKGQGHTESPLKVQGQSESSLKGEGHSGKELSSSSLSHLTYMSPRGYSKHPLQPIKKPDTITVKHTELNDENRPPTEVIGEDTAVRRHAEPSKSHDVLRHAEPPKKSHDVLRHAEPPNKSPLPPIKSAKVPCSDLSNEDSASPTSSVVMRDKAVTPAKSVMRRPVTMAATVDSPMKMFETPQWKKDLMDKRKKRESLNPGVLDKTDSPDSAVDSSVPPWKRELEMRKTRKSSIRSTTKEDNDEKTEEESVPDWIKQVHKRRSRYTDAGLIKTSENGQA